MKIVRATAGAALILALAAGPAQVATAAVTHPSSPALTSVKLPYSDPDQAGLLTLCGVNLKPITHGSIYAKPFVWRVVSSLPTPKGYFIKGAKTQMFAYQPRPYTPAGAWSGTVMAAASLYSNPKHPMAQFTPIDEPLTYMIDQFPPIWDHLIELRLYYGAPGLAEITRPYAAADIQVHGDTWSLVEGGHASCTDGKVESVEVLDHLPGATGTPAPSATDAPKHTLPPARTAAKDGPTPVSSTGTAAPQAGGSSSDGSSSGGTGVLVTLGIVVLALAVGASGGALWRRRRRATG